MSATDAALTWTATPPTEAGWQGLLLEPGDRPQWVQAELSPGGVFWIVFADGLSLQLRDLPAGALWLGPIRLPQAGRLVPPTGNLPRGGGR